MQMTPAYCYVLEDDLGETSISEAAAEIYRVGEWEQEEEGVDFALGRDAAGKSVRLYRVVTESYELAGPPVTYVIKFDIARVSFFGGPYDGEIVDSRKDGRQNSDPAEIFARWLSMCAVDGGDGTSIKGNEFSDGTITYKVTSVELAGDTLRIACEYVGRTVLNPQVDGPVPPQPPDGTT